MTQIRARLAAERQRIARAAEPRHLPPPGTLWRATPTRAECNTTAATGRPVMQKLWDLSPIDPWAFNGTEPPTALPPPPTNTVPPSIALFDGLAVGDQLAGQAGSWTGIASYSIVAIVSRAIRARALICLFRASPSAVKSPCFRAFLFPLGAPPPAPCIRQTLDP
jgi:hypothetical protein